MLVIGGATLGLIWGGLTAKKRGGSKADIAQYAAGYGIALAVLGMIATVIVHRMAI